jgi:hypothetical protein
MEVLEPVGSLVARLHVSALNLPVFRIIEQFSYLPRSRFEHGEPIFLNFKKRQRELNKKGRMEHEECEGPMGAMERATRSKIAPSHPHSAPDTSSSPPSPQL